MLMTAHDAAIVEVVNRTGRPRTRCVANALRGVDLQAVNSAITACEKVGPMGWRFGSFQWH